MADYMAPSPAGGKHSSFRRRDTPPDGLHEPEGYTSMRDLLRTPSCFGWLFYSAPAWPGDIQIKHPLVKQAALAYLQPLRSQRRRGFRLLLAAISSGFSSICRFLFGAIRNGRGR